MTTRLILVRHGQTDWNSAGRFMGSKDIPLNAAGLQQVEAVARRLSTERPLAIYSSDLSRAWQTAQSIRQAIGAAIETAASELAESASPDGLVQALQPHLPTLIPEPRLREMHFGSWEGCTYAELQAQQPEALAAWSADLLHVAPPEGESLLQMAGRVQAAYQEIAAAQVEGTILIVAHGGPLQVLLAQAMGMPVERYWQFHLNNTGWVELNLYPDGAILNRFNDLAHLETRHTVEVKRWPPAA